MSKLSKKITLASIAVAALATGSAVASIAQDPSAQQDAQQPLAHISCHGGENEITVIVNDIKKAVGLISADLFPNRKKDFLRSRGRIKKTIVAAKSPITHFCITVPEPGDYAIAIYHDKNANGKFDKNAFGLPGEPWGLSSNPKVRFRAPYVEETLFSVPEEGVTVEIDLN